MRARTWHYAALMFGILASGINAHSLRAEQPVIPKNSVEYRFWRVETKEIRGHLLKGLQGISNRTIIDTTILRLYGLDNSAQNICITFEDITGTFGADARVKNLPNSPSVGIDLPLEDNLIALRQHPDELSMKAWFSTRPNCVVLPSDKPDYVLPSWEEHSSASVRFFINVPTGSLARVMMSGANGPTECREIDIASTSNPRLSVQSFNQVCDVPLPPTCKHRTPFELVVDVGDKRDGAAGTLRRTCP